MKHVGRLAAGMLIVSVLINLGYFGLFFYKHANFWVLHLLWVLPGCYYIGWRFLDD